VKKIIILIHILLMSASTYATELPTVVLVHGAFEDGSSWGKVTSQLIKRGYKVIALQNNLKSLKEDVENTQKAIAKEKQVVLVGHSYGGAVITQAAFGKSNVKSLVYIAAFAPDETEQLGQLINKFEPAAINEALQPDETGSVYIKNEKYKEILIHEVSNHEALVIAASQRPISGAIFTEPMGKPAWSQIKSWYLLTQKDKALLPKVQKFMAERAKSKISAVDSGHGPHVTHANKVTKTIIEAAQ
jgi:pimeloyl-ACP methyl ester carboxylesterase